MSVLLSVLLLANAAYNAIVWPQFFKRVKNDVRARDEHGAYTAFFRVHAILIGIALVLALASAVAGIWGLVAA
ncbi:SCO4848 family membrane protein [Lysinibacter cavernae]|uniref:Uncharacterized protein n=1 Tax=Lysinibacter cavernae TaxID=1640652 RepID=A0A7X5QYS6_9MICO|nr:hypothetical protein [Lysinibacter cavernae]NIH52468.1 hypothetical protein [Lysinibacter cavernae]